MLIIRMIWISGIQKIELWVSQFVLSDACLELRAITCDETRSFVDDIWTKGFKKIRDVGWNSKSDLRKWRILLTSGGGYMIPTTGFIGPGSCCCGVSRVFTSRDGMTEGLGSGLNDEKQLWLKTYRLCCNLYGKYWHLIVVIILNSIG